MFLAARECTATPVMNYGKMASTFKNRRCQSWGNAKNHIDGEWHLAAISIGDTTLVSRCMMRCYDTTGCGFSLVVYAVPLLTIVNVSVECFCSATFICARVCISCPFTCVMTSPGSRPALTTKNKTIRQSKRVSTACTR